MFSKSYSAMDKKQMHNSTISKLSMMRTSVWLLIH